MLAQTREQVTESKWSTNRYSSSGDEVSRPDLGVRPA